MIELRIVRMKSKNYIGADGLQRNGYTTKTEDYLQYRDMVYHTSELGQGYYSGEEWLNVPVVEVTE